MRWPAGEGEQCKEPATRGGWVVGGCHTRKSWPASLFSLQFVRPPARPADVAFADVRGRLFILFLFHLFLFYFTPRSWGRTSHDIGTVIRLDMAKCGSTHGKPPTKSTVAAGFGSFHSSPPFSLRTFPSPSPSPSPPLPLPLSSRHVHDEPLRSLPLRRLPFRKYPIQETHIILSQGGSSSINNNRLCDFHRSGKPLPNKLYSLPINPSANFSHPNLS